MKLQMEWLKWAWTKTVVESYFRDPDGAPIQVFFDIQTIGDLDGRLDKEGATATGRAIVAEKAGSRNCSWQLPQFSSCESPVRTQSHSVHSGHWSAPLIPLRRTCTCIERKCAI